MSKIQRYAWLGTHSQMIPRSDGVWMYYDDHLADKAAAVEKAVKEERERVRAQEVEPLAATIEAVASRRPLVPVPQVPVVAFADWEWRDIVTALAAIRSVQAQGQSGKEGVRSL